MRRGLSKNKTFITGIVAALAFAMLVFIAVGAYRDHERRSLAAAASHVERVSASEAALVSYWMTQRASDVSILSTVSRVRTDFPEYLAGDRSKEAWLRQRLEAERTTRGYLNVSLFSVEGTRVVSSGEEDLSTAAVLAAFARQAAKPDAGMAIHAHVSADGGYHVGWFAPLLVDEGNTKPTVTGVVMYESDVRTYLTDVMRNETEPWFTLTELRLEQDGAVVTANSTDDFIFRPVPEKAGAGTGPLITANTSLGWPGATLVALVRRADVISSLSWARRSVWLAAGLAGVVFVLFVMAYALSERNRIRQLEAHARVAEALATQDRFLTNMSHDLRTPLNSIIGFAALLARGLAGEVNAEQSRQLGMIEASGKHLLRLVSDVLDLSLAKTGDEDVVPQWMLAWDAAEFVADALSPQVAEKHLRWVTDVPEDLELRTDRRLLERILLNLAGNAVKFTHEGTVTLTARQRADDEVAFSVKDSGPGIPAGAMPEVMQDFRQFHAPGAARPEGSGLGLPVCVATAELLGGRLEVDSQPGRGSTFTVVLPRNAIAVS